MDDGADLVSALHMIALNRLDDLAPPVRKWVETLSGADRKALVAGVAGSTEETTTGVIRLKAKARGGVLQRSEEHTSGLQAPAYFLFRLLLGKKKKSIY